MRLSFFCNFRSINQDAFNRRFFFRVVRMEDCILRRLVMSLTRMIRSQLAINYTNRTIFQTFAITNGRRFAFLTLTKGKILFRLSRLRLTFTMRRFRRYLFVGITRFMFQGCGIIAQVCITIRFRSANVSTDLNRNTSTQLHACPINRNEIRRLSRRVSCVLTCPFIGRNTRRISPLFQ